MHVVRQCTLFVAAIFFQDFGCTGALDSFARDTACAAGALGLDGWNNHASNKGLNDFPDTRSAYALKSATEALPYACS